MKNKLLYVLAVLSLPAFLAAQSFTWMRGQNTNGPIPGNYGTQGTASASNDPGHRHGAATWVDASGNLWMFGGEGYASSSTISWLNDLWKYNVSTNQWTWIRGTNGPNAVGNYGTQGVAANTNEPGAREFPVCWTDNSGNFWLFGGDGFAASTTFGRLGDLWKYNPTTNQWTWMKGFNTINNNGVYGTLSVSSATTLPGARYSAARWVEPATGDLWMFGGRGFPATGTDNLLNDLWRYNLASNNWTWMGGTNLPQQLGSYGTQGVPSVTNIPGSTEFPCSWVDNQGRFYMLTGRGYVSAGTPGYTNDMWRYNPVTGEWTWMKGSNLINQLSVPGQLGVSSASTQPSGRYASAYWTDASGNFWLFGGEGFPSAAATSSNIGALNDFYKYNPVTNQYTWMKGSQSTFASGTYGTMGVPGGNNMPGARYYTIAWRYTNGSIWLFGSEGIDGSGNPTDNMNDLWRYNIPCNPDSITAVGASPVPQHYVACSGNSLSLIASGPYASGILWYSNPTATNSIGSGTTFATPVLTATSGQSVYTYYAEANSCTLSPRAVVNITVTPPPAVTVAGNPTVCSGGPLTLSATGASSYSWNTGASGSPITVNPTTNSVYTVFGTNTLGCVGTANFSVSVTPGPTLSASGNTAVCKGASLTLTGNGALTYTWNGSVQGATFAATPSTTSTYTLSGQIANGCSGSIITTVTVLPLPTLSVSATKTLVCKNTPVTITASGASTYTWTNAAAPSSTYAVTPSLTTTFSVTATDANDCRNSAVITISVSNTCNYLGLSEPSATRFTLRLFPNPNNGEFSIGLDQSVTDAKIQVLNLLGELVYIQELSGPQTRIHGQLARGVYFVSLTREGTVVGSTRMIVE